MFKSIKNLFTKPCVHPVDSLKLVSYYKSWDNVHIIHKMNFTCTKCNTMQYREFESLTDRMSKRIEKHSNNMVEAMLFGIYKS